MNCLKAERKASVVAALVEGNSINATCRMTGVAKHTVLKLLKDLGCACAAYHDEHVPRFGNRFCARAACQQSSKEMDYLISFVHTNILGRRTARARPNPKRNKFKLHHYRGASNVSIRPLISDLPRSPSLRRNGFCLFGKQNRGDLP